MSVNFPNTALPPIGTSNNPFVGVFNGNNYCISNLWISSNPEDWKVTPIGYDAETIGTDIGFFGQVKKAGTQGNYCGGKAYNFYLENVEVTTNINHINEDTKSHTGLLCGYLNGTVMNAGVKNGKITYKTSGESTYSLVGDFSDEVQWIDKPSDEGAGNSDLRVIPVDINKSASAGQTVSIPNAPKWEDKPIAEIEGVFNLTNVKDNADNIYKFNSNTLTFGTTIGDTEDLSYFTKYSGTSNSSARNVLESDFWKAYDANKGFQPGGEPTWPTTANAKPTNCVWFKPLSSGKCTMAFRVGNMSGSVEYAIYRFNRDSSGKIIKPGTSDTLILQFNKSYLSNCDTVYYEFNIDEGYEYCISKAPGDRSTNGYFIFLKLGGAGHGALDDKKKLLMKIDYMETIPTNRTDSSNIWSSEYSIHNIIWTVETAPANSWIQYQVFTSDHKVHICYISGVDVDDTGDAGINNGTSTTGFYVFPTR